MSPTYDKTVTQKELLGKKIDSDEVEWKPTTKVDGVETLAKCDYTTEDGQTIRMELLSETDNQNFTYTIVRSFDSASPDSSYSNQNPDKVGYLEAISDQYSSKPYTSQKILYANTRPSHQRQGVATAMLEFARRETGVVEHSDNLSDDGKAFAEVSKHLTGKHDQSSHSGGGAGKAPKTAVGEKLTASVLENVKANGGLSVRLTNGSQPTSGFMVSRKGFGAIHPAKDFFNPEKGKQMLSDYLKKNKQYLSTGKDYLGVWHNKKNGMVYLDVSMKIADRQSAINSGIKNDQISIWDVTNFEEIETGGTGNV
jgi:hypothetical protein